MELLMSIATIALLSLVGAGVLVGMYFFLVTRGTLLFHRATGDAQPDAHVYWIYSKMPLIKLTDQKPLIAAILLLQYDRLVDEILRHLRRVDLREKDVLQTSCAFGDVIPKVTDAAITAGAKRMVIVDIITNELLHAKGKVAPHEASCLFLKDNATALSLPSESVSANVLFFLLHELPNNEKKRAIAEAMRVVEPGGALLIADFHKPSSWVLRAFGWMYFTVFEPYGLALWGEKYDPLGQIAREGWETERTTIFFDNFQVIAARRPTA